MKGKSKLVTVVDLLLSISRKPQSLHQETIRINELIKLQDTRLVCRNLAFLYTNDKLWDKESKKMTSLKVTSKRIKYLGNKLNQGHKSPKVWKL